MAKHIEVIYTNGVFCPSAPLEVALEEGQHLTLILLENGGEPDNFVEDEDLRKWCAERNCSGSENLTLAIQSPYGIPCRHGNTACIITRGVGTDPTRSANLYSGAGSACRDLGIHGPRLPGAGPPVTGTAEPNLTEFFPSTFERSATAWTAMSPSESSTSRRATGSPWPYTNADTDGRSR